MNARRIAAVLVAAHWLVPLALAGGVALHVAFDHGHAANPVHLDLALLAEHGHAHVGETGRHDHVVTSAPVAARRTVESVAAAPPATVAADEPLLAVTSTPLAGASTAPPPRASGPPLLALISTLRV